VEKYQGPDAGQNYIENVTDIRCCEEDRILATLRRVKEVNANTTTILYLNSVLDFPQYLLHNRFVQNSR
jgi:hypothetical protein